MSHFSKITAQIKDLKALKDAAESMGFTLLEDANCRYYYGEEHSDYVIKLPGSYDIAVTKQGDTFSMAADFYGRNVSSYVGQGAQLLIQQYAIQKIKNEVARMNLSILEMGKQGNNTTMKIVDPETGGVIKAVCSEEGEISFETSGFAGTGCMRFTELEESLGVVQKRTLTSEYYAPEPETGIERVTEILSSSEEE